MTRSTRKHAGFLSLAAGLALATAPAAQGQEFFPIGSLDGSTGARGQLNFVRAISADGQLAAGGAILSGTSVCDSQQGYTWYRGDGIQPFAVIGECVTSVFDMSADGQTIVGSGSPTNPLRAYFWTEDSGFTEIPQIFEDGGRTFFDPDTTRLRLTGDGSAVFGTGFSIEAGTSFIDSRPYRWTPSGGYEFLDIPPSSTVAIPTGTNSDGSVTVGFTRPGGGEAPLIPAIWSEDGSVRNIDGPADTSISFFRDVTPDGSVLIGGGRFTDSNVPRSYSWTEDGGWLDLGDFPAGGTGGFPLAVSDDGSVIVGTYTLFGFGGRAYIWTEDTGITDLNDFARGLGIDLLGWTLTEATAISADGRTIAGVGTNPAGVDDSWVLSLESTNCPADFDGDGRLSLFDFLAFQNAFDSGDLAADFDSDGRFSLFDFLAFQNAFDAGCD